MSFVNESTLRGDSTLTGDSVTWNTPCEGLSESSSVVTHIQCNCDREGKKKKKEEKNHLKESDKLKESTRS